MKNNKTGFTLIEIMVAIAIVAILASVILVSMKSFAVKGRSAKALAQLSSAIPSMVSCWGNGKDVNGPSSGGNICGSDSNYGKWPSVGSGTDLSTYSYSSDASSGKLSKSGWYVALSSGSSDDNMKICCNSAMNSCKADVSSSTCNATTPSN